MSNFFKILITIAIFYYFFVFNGGKLQNFKPLSNSTSVNSSSGFDSSLTNLTKKIPSNVTQYLQSSNDFGNYYSAGKKFVIYYTGMSCPRTKEFIDTTIAIANDPAYQQYYNFYRVDVQGDTMSKSFTSTEDANAYSEFMNVCQAFCIINPAQSRVYSIEAIGGSRANMVYTLFDKFKEW